MKRLVLIGLLFFTGCATQTKYVEKPAYLKCQIPDIPPAELTPIPENATYSEKLQVILNNCLKIKRENELLREALKLCQ